MENVTGFAAEEFELTTNLRAYIYIDNTHIYVMFLLHSSCWLSIELHAKTTCELQLKTSLNLLILQLKLFAQQQAIF